MRPLNVTYVLLHFPFLTETFVAEEINAIRAHGVNVTIVSLLEARSGRIQPLSEKLLAQTWYAPGFLAGPLWLAQLHFFLRRPRLYLALLARLLRQPRPRRPLTSLAKRLGIFLKAVAVAYHLRGSVTELLHSHFAWLSGAATWVVARLLGLPFSVTVHAYDIYASNDLLGLVCGEADHVVAISEFNRRYVTAAAACRVDAVSVIHCGVDLGRLTYLATERPRPAGEALRILSVGSLVLKKGHTHLIDACRVLREQGIAFTCTIIGGGPDERRLAAQVREHGLQSCVILRGACPHPEIIDAYRQHDLFVLASVVAPGGDRDGIPVVLMEAAAAGLPLISTDVSGIPELVRHNETGWVTPAGDVAALARAMITLGSDPRLRNRLGQNARALVEAEFSIESTAARLVDVFRSVRGCHRGDLSVTRSLQQSRS
jgi:glycosyltransferase involved in cell wall biosynthesis